MSPTHRRPFPFAAALLAGLAAITLLPAVAAASDATAAPGQAVVAGPDGRAPEALQIEQAWIRWLPANLPAGGYLTVANRGDQSVVLVGASSPDYAGVDLHRSVTEGGVSRMDPVARLVIPPHSMLDFAATGYHLMLMMPTRPVAPGDRVPVTLHFADGRTLLVNFEVHKPDASAPGTSPPMPAMPGMPGMPGMPAKPPSPH